MAERTVNVNINYKVNTAEVVRAQAAATAAQKATDELRKATENYGKASTTAHRQASQGARDTAQSFTSLYNSVKLFLAAGIVKEIADASIAMAKLGGNTEAVGRAFKNQIPGAINLLNELRKATMGTVHDLELMQLTLRAKNFGIAVERLPTLLKFAQIRAQQTGQSVDYLVNSIVDGLGRKSLLKLDNLQVSASRLKDEFKGVSLQSLSVAQVTQGFANVVDDELTKMGEAVNNSATLVDQLKVAWQETKTELSDSAFWSFIVKRFKDVTEGTTAIIRRLKGEGFDEQVRKRQIASAALLQANTFATENLTKSREENIEILDKELQRLTHELGLFAKRKELAEQTITLNGKLIRDSPYGADTYNLRANIDLQRDWIEAKQTDAEIDQETYKLLQDKLAALKAVNKEQADESGIIERKKKELEDLQSQLDKTNQMGDVGASGKLVLAIKKVQEELDVLLGKTKDAGAGVRDYLASLSEQEMYQTEQVLKDKGDQRKHDAEVEKDNNQRSYEHWQYYQDLKKQKQQEYADEQISIMEDNAARAEDLQRTMYGLTEDLLRSGVDFLLQTGESETDAIRSRYDEQIELAGDNDRKKKELRIKQEREIEKAREQEKQREQKAASTRILIDGLTAIAKIFAEYGWPAGIAPAAIMAGITATNVAAVRKYAKGGINIPGPGNETSDSIPAMLSRGESIITAKATRQSMGLLEAIQANKIDDRLMKSIDFSGGRSSFNDSRMVQKLESLESELKGIRQGQYKLEEQAGILYKVYGDEQGNRRKVRAKVGL